MEDKKLILIGEMHGTKEIPNKIKELCQSIQEDIIYCLELPIQIKSLFLNFLNNKLSLNQFLQNNLVKEAVQDGRITPALVESLKQIKHKINLEFVDDLESDIIKRDENIAINFVNIVKKHPNKKIILHCGNFHINDKIIMFENRMVKPARLFLPKEILNQCHTVIFLPSEGKYYNHGIKKVIYKTTYLKSTAEIKYTYLKVSPSYFK